MSAKYRRIYVAGSYGADNIIGCLNNIRIGIAKCAEILKKGDVPFCPWLDYQFQFFNATLTVEDYYRYSMAWLEVSDVIYVLKNNRSSEGAQKEIKRADELGIPIIFEEDS